MTKKMTQKSSVLYPDHPMFNAAVEAMQQYHQAQAYGAPALKIEQLRQIAESHFITLNEHQLDALGCCPRTLN